jgi:flagellar biosynthetic protein FliR
MGPESLLAQFSEQQVAAFFLVMARVSPMFLLAPLFSSKMINRRVKGIVAVALTVGIMPVVKHGEIDLDSFAYAGLLLKELVVGLAFAYALHAMFAALQAAGTLLDTLIGFSFGAIVDPVTGLVSPESADQMYDSPAGTTTPRISVPPLVWMLNWPR